MATETLVQKENRGFVNDVVSQAMYVHPLAENQVAYYKLVEADKPDKHRVDEKGSPMPRKPGAILQGIHQIYDSFKKKTVTILNVSTRPPRTNKRGESVSKPDPIFFRSGEIVRVFSHQQETYAFLERHSYNTTNPFRKNRTTPAFEFYRVDHKAKVEKDLEKDYFQFEASKWVMEQAKYQDLAACASKIREFRPEVQIKFDYKAEEEDLGFATLKKQLYALAQTDPHSVVKASTNVEAKMKMQIRDAEYYVLIFFGDDPKEKHGYRKWWLNETKLTEICEVPVGKHKIDGLMDYFKDKSKDGGAMYQKIVSKLKDLNTPR